MGQWSNLDTWLVTDTRDTSLIIDYWYHQTEFSSLNGQFIPQPNFLHLIHFIICEANEHYGTTVYYKLNFRAEYCFRSSAVQPNPVLQPPLYSRVLYYYLCCTTDYCITTSSVQPSTVFLPWLYNRVLYYNLLCTAKYLNTTAVQPGTSTILQPIYLPHFNPLPLLNVLCN